MNSFSVVKVAKEQTQPDSKRNNLSMKTNNSEEHEKQEDRASKHKEPRGNWFKKPKLAEVESEQTGDKQLKRKKQGQVRGCGGKGSERKTPKKQ